MCFVCHKEGCWSSNHTQEERDESRKRFKDKFNRRFNKHARQYITEYEGVDDADDLESIDEAINTLMIDFETPAEPQGYDQTELFLTSFGKI